MVEIQLERYSDRNTLALDGSVWQDLQPPPPSPMINGENVPLMRSS